MAMYLQGHHDTVLRSHRWRTAENSAAYLLPHLRPGMPVLDVGCGPGTITRDLGALVGPGGEVLGVDSAAAGNTLGKMLPTPLRWVNCPRLGLSGERAPPGAGCQAEVAIARQQAQDVKLGHAAGGVIPRAMLAPGAGRHREPVIVQVEHPEGVADLTGQPVHRPYAKLSRSPCS